jgi:ribosome-binding ATPase YchF (GTP1/OBG family)
VKIAVVGLPEFPFGKKNMPDGRLDTLEGLIKPSKTTYITNEYLDGARLKDADAIICEKEAKLDLVIQDLEVVENRIERLAAGEEKDFSLRLKEILEKNKCLIEENFSEEEKKTLLNYNLVSIKPIFFVDKNENKPLNEIMFESYYVFGMICFITGAKDEELKAWPIKKGATAYDAAGTIHSAIQQKFIKAEIISYDDTVRAGGLNQARQYMRLEGRGYVMQDADLLNVRT